MFHNFFSENRAVYHTMSKNVVEPERPPMTIWQRVSKVTRAQVHARTSDALEENLPQRHFAHRKSHKVQPPPARWHNCEHLGRSIMLTGKESSAKISTEALSITQVLQSRMRQ